MKMSRKSGQESKIGPYLNRIMIECGEKIGRKF